MPLLEKHNPTKQKENKQSYRVTQTRRDVHDVAAAEEEKETRTISSQQQLQDGNTRKASTQTGNNQYSADRQIPIRDAAAKNEQRTQPLTALSNR